MLHLKHESYPGNRESLLFLYLKKSLDTFFPPLSHLKNTL